MFGTRRIFLSAMLSLVLIPAQLFAQQYISGSLSGNLGPGTYIVDGNCRVENGSMLTILPGTEFQHTGHYTWNIYGQLFAEGSETDSIKFTRQMPITSHRWGGIRFTPTVLQQSRMNYCVVEHVYNTGTITSVRNVDTRSPPMIVQPIGPHIEPPRSVRGKSPQIVVMVVSRIGIKRVSPAVFSAVNKSLPCLRS